MSVKLTHIGEVLVAALIDAKPARFFEVAQLPYREIHGGKAFTEARLLAYESSTFDGASRVDVVVPISDFQAIPIEVKLGTTRMSSGRVEKEWLNMCKECGHSHQGKRWVGSMMAFLNGQLPAMTGDKFLQVYRGDTNVQKFSLTREWCIVVRQSVKDSWGSYFDKLMPRAKVIAIEDLIDNSTFNEVVCKVLDLDFHGAWFGRT